MKKYISIQKNTEKGFTLIEMMVAVSIFSIVMLVAVGALLTIVDANRKAQAIKSVTNNLNFALESMSRTIRTGTSYYCGDSSDLPPISGISNCPSGGELIAFEKSGGIKSDPNDQVVYRLNAVDFNGTPHGQIERSTDAGFNFVPITDSQVDITKLEFHVVGSSSSDEFQPRVFIVIKGVTGLARSRTEFNLQTTVTQRLLDF